MQYLWCLGVPYRTKFENRYLLRLISFVEAIDEMPHFLKRPYKICSTIGFCLVISLYWSPIHAFGQPPNILLVIADDMGIDASPCYSVGDLKPTMPVLEELCRTGVVFENVWSNPEFSAARAAIVTCRY